MAKLRDYTSRLGFSVMIPASWGYNENTEKVDLSAKEQERQNKWLEVGKGSAVAEKAAMMFVETLSGLSTAVQCIEATGRKVFYETFLAECVKGPVDVLARDKTNAAQMNFLLAPHREALKDWTEISATTLLITLQKLTDSERLQAKVELGSQLGYFIVGDNNNSDSPYMTVLKFGMMAVKTSVELYSLYKRSLPVWFWSGIPDKVRAIKNRTVDGGEVMAADNYLTYSDTASIYAYAVKGTTGWAIICTASNFHKYKGMFNKLVESFRIQRHGPNNGEPIYAQMRCFNCGSPITINQGVCGACGTELVIHCPNCGGTTSPANTFCGSCGVRLS